MSGGGQMKVSITRGRWKSRAATCAPEQSSIIRLEAEDDVSVSAYYCFVAVIIHGTWFPLESSVLNPRCDTLVSYLFPQRNNSEYWSRSAYFLFLPLVERSMLG